MLHTEPPPTHLDLSPAAFELVRKRIYAKAGISLGDGKRLMVEGRLGKIVRDLKLPSYEAYLKHLDQAGSGSADETHFINALTTNKTEFFREEHHFEFLAESVFPAVLARAERGGPKRLRIWCAASSTGEEPWTLAMTVFESFGTRAGWDIQILASDIDTNVLETAKRGVYADDRMGGISDARRARHFATGQGQAAGWCRIREHLRPLVSFRQVNLIADRWDIPNGLDVIFCRNVIIYFDRPTQTKLFSRMADLMAPGGYLFAGHSESLLGVTERFGPIGNTVYRVVKSGAPTSNGGARAPEAPRAAPPAPLPPRAAPPPPVAPPQLPIQRIIVGQVLASDKPARISTTLGSCVAACLWDPETGIGGMNHFLLPDGDPGSSDPARYGIHAMELLINKIMNLGGDRRRLQAKVLGASRLASVVSNVSQRNAAFIRQFLKDEGITLQSERLLGERPLEVHFLPHTGQVLVREVAANAVTETESRAAKLARSVAAAQSAALDHNPNVTLF